MLLKPIKRLTQLPNRHLQIIASASVAEKPIIAVADDVKIHAAEGDKQGPRTFDATIYTGGKLKVAGYDHPVVIDLAGLSARKRINANLDHKKDQRVGQVTKRVNDGKSLRVEGLLNAASKSRDEVLASSDDGYDWGASIEALPTKLVKVPADKTVNVNGQEHEGPLYIARKSTLRGFAFLDGEADENTSVTIAAAAASEGELSMEFTKWIEAAGFTADEYAELTDKQKAGLKTKYEAEIKAAAKNPPAPEVDDDGPEWDVNDIRAAAAELGDTIEAKLAEYEDNITDRKKLAEIKANAKKAARELKAQAVKEKWTVAKFETKAVEATSKVEVELVRAERPTGPAIHASMRDMNNRVVEAALCQSINLPKIEDQFEDKELQAAHDSFKGRIGLQQILIMAASANGYQCRPGERITQGNLRTVLRHALPIEGSDFSTFSLPNILTAVANKQILAGYMEEDQTWREIAEVKSVSNFFTQNFYRMLDSLEYELVGSGGEIKHGTLGEETYTAQAKTYAKMLGITRQQIINDDKGALDDVRPRLGRGAAKSFNTIFWTAFINNSSFFTAALTNYITGSTTNLGTDGVGLGLVQAAFRQMTTPTADGSKRVGNGMNPDRILVPPELEVNADIAYRNTNLGMVANGSANIFQNKYRPVVQWRLSNSSFTGYSTTAYYVFGDTMRPMVATFLDGNQTPTVESADADFDMLGIQFRGYHDFGCDKSEYLAGVKSKGAA